MSNDLLRFLVLWRDRLFDLFTRLQAYTNTTQLTFVLSLCVVLCCAVLMFKVHSSSHYLCLCEFERIQQIKQLYLHTGLRCTKYMREGKEKNPDNQIQPPQIDRDEWWDKAQSDMNRSFLSISFWLESCSLPLLNLASIRQQTRGNSNRIFLLILNMGTDRHNISEYCCNFYYILYCKLVGRLIFYQWIKWYQRYF